MYVIFMFYLPMMELVHYHILRAQNEPLNISLEKKYISKSMVCMKKINEDSRVSSLNKVTRTSSFKAWYSHRA